jgi:hypothetical protein
MEAAALTAGLDAQIAQANSELASLKNDHGQVSLQLATKPEDAATHEQLAQLEQEIAGCQTKIKRLQSAKGEAARLDTATAKRAKAKALTAAKKQLAEGPAQVAEHIKNVLVALDAIGTELVAIQTLIDDTAGRAWSIVKDCSNDLGEAERQFNGIADYIRGGAFRGLVIDALYKSGLGRSGLNLLAFVDVRPVGTDATLDTAARTMQDRIFSVIDRLVERRLDELKK